MESLKALDHVAYVRFASVYRSFQDLAEFRTRLNLWKPSRPKATRVNDAQDRRWMQRAIELGQQARYWSAPNPR